MITLSEITAYWAHRKPDAEAVVCGDTRYNWREFDALARALAAGLQSCGVEPGDRVAILLGNCAEWAVTFAAIALCGGVIVPLNPRFGRLELREIEDDAECRLVVATRLDGKELADRFNFGEGPESEILVAPRRESGRPHQTYAELATRLGDLRLVQIDPDALAAIFYTSGSTGLPKGTMHTHRSIQAGVFAHVLALQLTSDDRMLVLAPLAFTGACLVRFTPMLMIGACTVIEHSFDAAHALGQIQRERISITSGVPVLLERMAALPGFAVANLSSLRLMMTGGSPIPMGLLEVYRRRGIMLRPTYGCTEAGGMVCCPPVVVALGKPASVGASQLGTQVRVVTSQGADCATGEVGEIWLRGEQIMTGYWRNPDATAAAFVDGWYRSGDLGFIDQDGDLSIVDRLKNMIISGGVNIYPAEIEHALGSIEAIQEIGVFGASDATWGERVVALIYSPEGLDLESLKAQARQLLGPIKTPRDIVVSPTPLPRTVTNKISRGDLPGVYAALAARQAEPL